MNFAEWTQTFRPQQAHGELQWHRQCSRILISLGLSWCLVTHILYMLVCKHWVFTIDGNKKFLSMTEYRFCPTVLEIINWGVWGITICLMLKWVLEILLLHKLSQWEFCGSCGLTGSWFLSSGSQPRSQVKVTSSQRELGDQTAFLAPTPPLITGQP